MLKSILTRSLPSRPQKASDKCFRESECLSFDDYVDLSVEFSRKKARKNNMTSADPICMAHSTFIVTTESREILDLAIASMNDTSSPFKVIVNGQDITQNTGNVRMIQNIMQVMMSFTQLSRLFRCS
jgi:hypothetical protein